MSSPLAPEFRSVRFAGKFSDVEALNRGDPEALRPTLDSQVGANWSSIAPPLRRSALVLGGNGFVGGHLVAHLSTRPEIDKVYALVRGERVPPRERFEATLKKYQLSNVDRAKIEVVEGTPTAPALGLEDGVHAELSNTVDMVFNCASSTDYTVGYLDLRSDWVLSLLRVIEFSAKDRPKHLTYLGSVGRFFYQEPRDFTRPDSWWYSGYAQMKWVNAQLLMSLGAQGFPVTLCETPYVLGSTTLGIDPGRTYSMWRILELVKTLGVIWEGPGMNYVPVDVLVESITANSLSEKPLTRMLPRNVEPYSTALWAAGMNIEVAPWRVFASEVEQRAPRVMDSLFSSNIDRLVRIVNAPAAVFPKAYELPSVTNEAVFERYFSKIQFRHLKWIKPALAVADLSALEAATERAG